MDAGDAGRWVSYDAGQPGDTEGVNMDINCLDMGTTCNQVVSGNSTEELVAAVCGHMRLAHGYTDSQLESQDLREMITGAIWQSSRPPELRTPRPDV